MDNGEDLAAFFARVSRELLGDPDESVTLQRIADRAVDIVPACDWSGISRRRRHGVETIAATSPLAEVAGSWQAELGEGPSMDGVDGADRAGQSILVDDVHSDPRWPLWSKRVAAAGVGSMLSVHLSTGGHTIGDLTLYAARPHAFDAESVARALIFAPHAAAAARAANRISGLRAAMESRQVIGVAQGVIMQRYDMTIDASMEVLRRYSSHTNVKLRDLAAVVIVQGLPDDYARLAQDQIATDPEPEDRDPGTTGSGA